MEEMVINYLKTIIYYELATTEKQTSEVAIKFFDVGGKEFCDNLMKFMPEEHPAKVNFEKMKDVTSEEFMKIQKIVFTKMAIHEIEAKMPGWDFIASDEDVNAFAESVNECNLDNIENFIEKNKEILNKEPNKYEFYFAILYKYLLDMDENKNNLDFMLKESDLLEQVKSLDIDQKYKYLYELYAEISCSYHDNKEYRLAEQYYKKNNDLLKEYLKKQNGCKIENQYAVNLFNLGYLYTDMEIYDEAEKLINESLEIRKSFIKKYPEFTEKAKKGQAICYEELAYIYKTRFKADKNKELEQKYIDLYKKAIDIRMNLIQEQEDFDKIVRNYNHIASDYYYLFDDENAEKTYKKVIELCEKEGKTEELENAKNNLNQFYIDKEKYKK